MAWNHFELRRCVFLVEMHICSFQSQLTTVRHRIPRIHRKIENCKLQLIWVGVSSPKASSHYCFNCDLFPDSAPKQIGHTGHKPTQFNWLGIKRLLAGKSEKPLRKRLRSACAPHSVFSRSLEPISV